MTLYSVRSIFRLEFINWSWKQIFGSGWMGLHNVFKLICILTTLSLVVWCAYEFSKNEDICEVSFKGFLEDNDSVYPDLIFGVQNRFNETVLRTYDQTFNEDNYRRFLYGGSDWDAKMLDVDFDKVSMQLKDYVIDICVYKSAKNWFSDICENNVIIKRFDVFGDSIFTVNFPFDQTIFEASIKLKNSIFYNGLRPPDLEFSVRFAYPNQLYGSNARNFYKWPVRTNESTKNYVMRFELRSMEVIRRRHKKENDCYEMDDYDNKIMDAIIKNVGCRPSMWITNRSEPLCKTRDSFRQVYGEHYDQFARLTKNMKYLDPCLDIESLQMDYTEHNIPSIGRMSEANDEGWFTLQFAPMTTKFKEIKQIRKYSVQSLVGNAGGYIGLFLGYALWNVPIIILDIWKHIKEI